MPIARSSRRSRRVTRRSSPNRATTTTSTRSSPSSSHRRRPFLVEEHPLAGGVANAGSVVRVGEHVLRPSNEHTASIHAFLRSLRAVGFAGASEPVGIDPDGRERLVFIPGDVAVPPYPSWVQSDAALASIATLLSSFHQAAAEVGVVGSGWSTEMADP